MGICYVGICDVGIRDVRIYDVSIFCGFRVRVSFFRKDRWSYYDF